MGVEQDRDEGASGSEGIARSIARIALLSRRGLRVAAGRINETLQPQALSLLLRIAHDGPTTTKDLATHFGIDTATASRQVKRLRELGLIEVTPDTRDRRVLNITASATGRDTIAAMTVEWVQSVSGRLAGWTGDDQEQFARLLARFVADRGTGPAGPTARS